jgi:hypothetical protein
MVDAPNAHGEDCVGSAIPRAREVDVVATPTVLSPVLDETTLAIPIIFSLIGVTALVAGIR